MQEVIPGMGLQDDKFLYVAAANTGDKSTTVTHLAGFVYKSWWHWLLRRAANVFVVPDPALGQLPAQLSPGDRWTGRIKQTEELERWSRESRLYVGIHHSLAKRAKCVRVVIAQPETE